MQTQVVALMDWIDELVQASLDRGPSWRPEFEKCARGCNEGFHGETKGLCPGAYGVLDVDAVQNQGVLDWTKIP
jgi:hypothetical protein